MNSIPEDEESGSDSSEYPPDSESGTAVRMLIVSNTLPVTQSEDGWNYHPTKLAGLASAIQNLKNSGDIQEFVFIGGIRSNESERNSHNTNKLCALKQLNCVPIVIPNDLIEPYYNGMCKSCLWPLLHYRLHSVRHDPKWFDAYQKVNELFADTVLYHCRPGDFIWIQDYHLMLLPSLLRERLARGVPIGFFFHVPFPSSELFRILPRRKELLSGVLGADIIGFQAFEYIRHFGSTVARLLGVETGPRGVECPYDGGHYVRMGVFPAGIDPNIFIESLNLPAVKERINQLRTLFKNKYVLVGRDRLDEIEGVPLKLNALEIFFKKYPEWLGKVALFQIYEPSENETESEDQRALQKIVNEMVGRLNGQFGTVDYMPIEYINKKLTFEEICALYSVADVALITPIRDGMNLVSHEYVVCQADKHGVLVLSEFTGAARCLSGARLVNPFDKRDIADAINEALRLSEEDKMVKHQYNYNYVTCNTSTFWVKRFFDELVNIKTIIFHTPVPLLDLDLLRDTYRRSQKRVFLLDYDGTLSPVVKHPKLAVPSTDLIKILERLANNPRNKVFVISGRDRASLEGWLGHLDVGLSCEHGAFFRESKDSAWEDHSPKSDMEWKSAVIPLMEDFVERTPGAFIEQKQLNITWHYRNCDPEYGNFQARELMAQLQSIASKYPVEVVIGKKAIEVKPPGFSKGHIVRLIMSRHQDAEFAFCVGDDKTDEDMFVALAESPKSYFTCRVMADAKHQTQAKYWVETYSDVLDILSDLASLEDSKVVPPVIRPMRRNSLLAFGNAALLEKGKKSITPLDSSNISQPQQLP